MTGCNPLAFPANSCCKVSPEMSPQKEKEEEAMQTVPFRAAVGSLMHVMVMLRPDIAYSEGKSPNTHSSRVNSTGRP